MNEAELIRDICRVYQKHGWTLRRVLLTDERRGELESLLESSAPIFVSEVNALLFSRLSANGEAFEMRLISQAPFALFENFGANMSEEERNSAVKKMEQRLRERAGK